MYSQAGKHHQNDPKVGESSITSRTKQARRLLMWGVLVQKLYKVVKIVHKNCCSRNTAKLIIFVMKKNTGYIPLLQNLNEFFVSITGLV